MSNFKLRGLVAAPFTPMTADGAVNYDRVAPLAVSLIHNGVAGAFICGTTGESLSLTVAERKLVAESWKETCGDGLKLIVHVGTPSIEDAKALASHAQLINADAIGCMAPCFFKPSQVEDLVDFCRQVAAAAPKLPFYFYHIPCITGVSIPMFDFLRCASEKIPTLVGVKFTHEDMMDFARCVHLEDGRFDMLFGRDEMMLSGLALGAKGAVGSTFNYAAPLYHKIIKAFEGGDLVAARDAQNKANAMIAVLIKYGGTPAAGKAFMKYIGQDCGAVRSPLRSIDERHYQKFVKSVQAIGLDDFACRSV